jgi:hypothetical protein
MAWEKRSVAVTELGLIGFIMDCGEGKSFAACRANRFGAAAYSEVEDRQA